MTDDAKEPALDTTVLELAEPLSGFDLPDEVLRTDQDEWLSASLALRSASGNEGHMRDLELFPGAPKFKLDSELPDPLASDLHPVARERFLAADEAYVKATGGEHLSITSGLRTVERQADLYICWRLGNVGCNPADIPGASIHNYGLAIDIRDAHKDLVISTLSANGWERTVMPGEPWHWECVGTEAHTAAVRRKEVMRAPGSIARRWQASWESARERNDERNAKVEGHDQRRAALQSDLDAHQADGAAFKQSVAEYNRAKEQYTRDTEHHRQRLEAYNGEMQSLSELQRRIEHTPRGPQRNQMIQEYNQRRAAAQQEYNWLEQERIRIQQVAHPQLVKHHADLGQWRQRGQERQKKLAAEDLALTELKGEIDALETQIQTHMSEARTLLSQIARQVQP